MTDMETTAKKENLKFSENRDGKESSRLKDIMNGQSRRKPCLTMKYMLHICSNGENTNSRTLMRLRNC